MIKSIEDKLLPFFKDQKKFILLNPNLGVFLDKLDKQEVEQLWDLSNKIFLISLPPDIQKVYIEKSKYMKALSKIDGDPVTLLTTIVHAFRYSEANQVVESEQELAIFMKKLCEIIHFYFLKKMKAAKIKGSIKISDRNKFKISRSIYELYKMRDVVEAEYGPQPGTPEVFDYLKDFIKEKKSEIADMSSIIKV